MTNAQGDALLTLKTPGIGFEGYLRVHGTDMITMDQYMLPPIADANSRYLQGDWQPVAFLATEWESLAKKFGVWVLDPAKGHVIVSTMNCDDVFTSEMAVKLNGGDPNWHGSGDNVFFNVAPGAVDVVGTLGGTQVAHVSGAVVAGRILALSFGPTP